MGFALPVDRDADTRLPGMSGVPIVSGVDLEIIVMTTRLSVAWRRSRHARAVAEPGIFRVMPSFSPLLRVLVVEDEPLLRWSITETLAGSGHTVTGAHDGAGALQAVTDAPHPFDIVMLNHPLPDSNDFVLLSELQRRSPESAVVFMTVFGRPDVVACARRHGVSGVLRKPFDMHVVNRAVADAAGV